MKIIVMKFVMNGIKGLDWNGLHMQNNSSTVKFCLNMDLDTDPLVF
jgi:hypothetical protein